jgi:hypothetical protein
VPSGPESKVDYESWCRLIALSPELQLLPAREIINPFTRRPSVVAPRPDTAWIIVDGVEVGSASWTMDEDDPLVNVSVERTALPLVQRWGAELGGILREDPSP